MTDKGRMENNDNTGIIDPSEIRWPLETNSTNLSKKKTEELEKF